MDDKQDALPIENCDSIDALDYQRVIYNDIINGDDILKYAGLMDII